MQVTILISPFHSVELKYSLHRSNLFRSQASKWQSWDVRRGHLTPEDMFILHVIHTYRWAPHWHVEVRLTEVGYEVSTEHEVGRASGGRGELYTRFQFVYWRFSCPFCYLFSPNMVLIP